MEAESDIIIWLQFRFLSQHYNAQNIRTNRYVGLCFDVVLYFFMLFVFCSHNSGTCDMGRKPLNFFFF